MFIGRLHFRLLVVLDCCEFAARVLQVGCFVWLIVFGLEFVLCGCLYLVGCLVVVFRWFNCVVCVRRYLCFMIAFILFLFNACCLCVSCVGVVFVYFVILLCVITAWVWLLILMFVLIVTFVVL